MPALTAHPVETSLDAPVRRNAVGDAVKRAIDIAAGLVGLILAAPVLAAVSLWIKWDSPGPVFYRGLRTGRYGKPFRIFKFRTMIQNAENLGGPSTALNDKRLTRAGRFLRKYKIDELPQIFNVLSGDMSLVGPRPQVEFYTSRYQGIEKRILDVRPGLTDYASIRFVHLDSLLGDEGVDEKYQREIEPEKNKLRLQYALNHSLWIDFVLLAKTVVALLRIKRLWNTKS